MKRIEWLRGKVPALLFKKRKLSQMKFSLNEPQIRRLWILTVCGSISSTDPMTSHVRRGNSWLAFGLRYCEDYYAPPMNDIGPHALSFYHKGHIRKYQKISFSISFFFLFSFWVGGTIEISKFSKLLEGQDSILDEV